MRRFAKLLITVVLLAETTLIENPGPSPSPSATPRSGGTKMQTSRKVSPEDKMPAKQKKAVEATKKGHNASSYDPDHGPLLD